MNKPLSIKYFLILLGIIILCFSCYQREDITSSFNGEVFNFTMTDADEQRISTQMGKQFFVDKPLPVLHLANKSIAVERFKIRGQNSLNFQKKSFSVTLSEPLKVPNNGAYYYGKKFKLVSMVYDYTYIENMVALKLHKETGVWTLPVFYAEVSINSNHKGLYLFISDPEEYFLKYKNENFILRREYWNGIRRYEQNSSDLTSEEIYTDRYLSIYTLIQNKQGVELYKALSDIIDMEAYFTKLAVDYLIRNGDATDEIFFYTQKKGDKELFTPLPWDCDDIFSEFPHEVGRTWGTSRSVFGNRTYLTYDDIISDVGVKLLFSIEEDLDYKIATDQFLYQKYLEQLELVLNILDENKIRKVFDDVSNDVSVFYEKLDLEELSKYDETPTSNALFLNNLHQKRKLVLDQHQTLQTAIANVSE